MAEKEFLTVSELNNLIKDVVNTGFPYPVWVCGEIQGYNRNRSKNHIFFELVEKDAKSKDFKAKIGLVIFAGKKFQIAQILRKGGSPFELKDDIEVKFACKIDFYAPHGAMRLVVESIDPVYTLGKLAQAKQKLIAELKEKGTLDKNKQQELSLVPLKIGLITSDDSAAYNDFRSELQKSGFGFKILLHNATMQGKKTEGEVAKAIATLNKIKDLDCIVVTRGGGSIADLSCFDSQKIAEAIADSNLPVLSGIGHEIDMSITDMAAHTYAKTPTAIAKFLITLIEEFLTRIDEYKDRICNYALTKMDTEKNQLKNSAVRLQNGTLQYLKDHNTQIIRFSEIIRQRPNMLLKDQQKILVTQSDALTKTIKRRLENTQLQLKNYQKVIDVLHPANTLKRGFSITRKKNGQAVKSISDVSNKQELVTELIDGTIESQVVSNLKQVGV